MAYDQKRVVDAIRAFEAGEIVVVVDDEAEARAFAGGGPLEHLEISVGIAEGHDGTQQVELFVTLIGRPTTDITVNYATAVFRTWDVDPDDKAEASRFTALQQAMRTEFQELKLVVEQTGNGLAASLGELEDRLERQLPARGSEHL